MRDPKPTNGRTGFSLSRPLGGTGFSLSSPQPVMPPRWDRLQPVIPSRPAFTLTELLVVVAIILGLMALLAGAVGNVRTTQKANATRDLIAKLDRIISAQIETYDSLAIDTSDTRKLGLPARGTSQFPSDLVFKYAASVRAWHIRRNLISVDMPDRWTDVQAMTQLFNDKKWTMPFGDTQKTYSPFQRIYLGIWNQILAAKNYPTDQFSGAECLFMIVMQSGVANCLDCGSLTTSNVGDKDSDGYMEFLDAWGNPIDYILWAPAYRLPGQSTPYYEGRRDNPYGVVNVRPMLGMRPLIYSPGPDGQYAINRVKDPNAAPPAFPANADMATVSTTTDPYGALCGDWNVAPLSNSGAPTGRGADDNITNLDAEAKQ